MHKKKIVFVIGQLTHGGAEKQLLLLAEKINKDLFNFNVISLSMNSNPYGNLLKKEGIHVRYIKRNSRFDIKRLITLTSLFYKIKPDVIISSLSEANIYCFLSRILFFYKSKYVAQVRSMPDHISGLTKYLNILAYYSADVIITNTIHSFSFITTFYKQSSKNIKVINNGLRLVPKPKYKISNESLDIGIISKDTNVKNIDLFINSSLDVLKKYPNLKIHLCGKGLGDNNRFRGKIKKNKSSFVFYGELDDVKMFYKKLDIFVLTSRSEGLPNVLLESMSHGLPIVSTAVGGVTGLITHKINGMLVESEDRDSLSNCIIELINNKKLRNSLSVNSRDFIKQKYNINKMVKSFEKIFSASSF